METYDVVNLQGGGVHLERGADGAHLAEGADERSECLSVGQRTVVHHPGRKTGLCEAQSRLWQA